MAAEGFYLVQGDKTTCGGKITTGAEDHTLFDKPAAREQDSVTCGKHAGLFKIAGGIDNDTIHDRRMAGTLDSYSTCPCKAKFIPSMMDDTYEKSSGSSSGESAAGFTAAPTQASPELPGYLTGEQKPTGFVPDYPVLINTHDFPDEKLRSLMRQNNQDLMLLTLPEVFEILSSWGAWKHGWVDITQNEPAQIVINYGLNIKDVVTTSMLVSQLGSFGIKATVYVNHKGTELIKISGYPGIRKILNAPVFAAKNPQIVDIGIGKYGLAKTIIEGARLTFYVAAAYRTVDFLMNDETSLAEFIGSLATDMVKIGIGSAIVWGVGLVLVTPWIVANLAIVVVVGAVASITLNALDDKFGFTDKIVAYIESAQQEFANKAREKIKDTERDLIDLGAMFAESMLKKGREVVVEQIQRYIRNDLMSIQRRLY
ncbi:PAAR domain-containing protein [Enterobacter sp. WCHEn045836]|uniref:PAAR domain-containing protein n=1 Tax=Enterobacter sp. WCHEn045836 TaxID=2497434 RepID=UPI000F834FD1|nr:PAAR domain-containing protein [Enterobacter sp. WCHEn045836]RTQ04865.1 PAAR domain-containing protein [Enterobacter sp. WCHEn045836]